MVSGTSLVSRHRKTDPDLFLYPVLPQINIKRRSSTTFANIGNSDLKTRAHEVYSKVPPQLHIHKRLLSSSKDDQVTRWRLLCDRLDWLRMNFLIERLLTERGGVSKRDLVRGFLIRIDKKRLPLHQGLANHQKNM